MFKQIFLGTKFWHMATPRGYGPEGSPDDHSFTKGIVRNDERLYLHCQFLSKEGP